MVLGEAQPVVWVDSYQYQLLLQYCSTDSTMVLSVSGSSKKGNSWKAKARVGAVAFAASVLLPASALDNGQALTPPMGWANWNGFGCNYNDTTIRQQADFLNSSGMAAAGYRTVIIQECITKSGHRDAKGVPQPDPEKFPHGIKGLCDYIHEKGTFSGVFETNYCMHACMHACMVGIAPSAYIFHISQSTVTTVSMKQREPCDAMPGDPAISDLRSKGSFILQHHISIGLDLCYALTFSQ